MQEILEAKFNAPIKAILEFLSDKILIMKIISKNRRIAFYRL